MNHRRKSKKRSSQKTPWRAEKFSFCLMPPAYEAGKAAILAAIDRAPTCHEICTMNAMLSFLLGTICPSPATEADLKRMAAEILPRLLESISIASGRRLTAIALNSAECEFSPMAHTPDGDLN